ncbi:MAG: M48 family metalloprotease [Thermofilaceae archaeon]
MSGLPILEKDLPYIDLSDDTVRKRFEKFLLNVITEKYGRYMRSALNVSYAGSPGMLFYIDDESGPLFEILISYSSNSIQYRVTLLRPFTIRMMLEGVARLLESALNFFAETGGFGAAYFVFVPGRRLIPPRAESKSKRTLQSLFLGNLVFIFAISILISYAVFIVFGSYTPIVLVLMQIPIMVISYKITPLIMGDWKLDSSHRLVYLIGLKMPIEKYQIVLQKVLLPHRFDVKKKLYESSLERGEEPNEESVKKVLTELNLQPEEYEIEIRKVDLYNIVEQVAKRFKLKNVPSVYLSNIIYPNAAASGVCPSLASVLITTGLISRLDEAEIEAVIGHEISHLKRRDVLTFFVLSSIEYLSRVYLTLLLWPLLATPLGLFYLSFSLTVFFVVAKFVEMRADIDSALYVGRPEKLASALRKIGLKHIFLESSPWGRLMAWLKWDPHPPVTYRIEQLSKMASSGIIRGPWRKAISCSLADISRSFRLMLFAHL